MVPDDVTARPLGDEPRWVQLAEDLDTPWPHRWALHELVNAIDAAPPWQAWWSGAGRPQLWLTLRAGATGAGGVDAVRAGRRTVMAQWILDGAQLDPAADGDGLAAAARRDLGAALARVAAELGLAAPPPLPQPPGPPPVQQADADPTRAVLDDMLRRGLSHLGLDG